MSARELTLPVVQKEGFSLVPTLKDQTLVVRFAGNGDMEATPILGMYLKRVHEEVCRLAIREVVFDIGELYFMNSSCLKAFITWLCLVHEMEEADRCVARFLSNPRLHWQRRSLEALRHYAPDVVRIDVVEAEVTRAG